MFAGRFSRKLSCYLVQLFSLVSLNQLINDLSCKSKLFIKVATRSPFSGNCALCLPAGFLKNFRVI